MDIGRGFMASRRTPPLRRRLLARALRLVVPRRGVFRPLLRTGQALRRLLPAALAAHVPERRPLPSFPAAPRSERRVIVLDGCVQSAATPAVNRALEYLLGTRGIAVDRLREEGCCGALDYHLGAHEAGLRRMRALVDQLEPRLGEVEAIVSTASGCGVTIKEYPSMLALDPEYRERAERVAAACVDASELLADMEFTARPMRVACHVPCTLQHGQKLAGFREILAAAGMETVDVAEGHLCCGSAGTYSILEPALATKLRDRKRTALMSGGPEVIATANVGCQLHLDGADVPVRHWLELPAEQVRLLEEPP